MHTAQPYPVASFDALVSHRISLPREQARTFALLDAACHADQLLTPEEQRICDMATD